MSSLVLVRRRSKNSAGFDVRRRRALVVLTPLVDVVFILLVFFMLVSSFSDQGVIGIITPTAAPRADQTSGAVLIRIADDGSLDFNGAPVSAVQLAREVGKRSLADGTLTYLVQPDSGVAVQQLVSVVDLLKDAGARNVSLTRKLPRS